MVFSVILGALALALGANAHGAVSGVVSGGQYYRGWVYDYLYYGDRTLPPYVTWGNTNQGRGPISPSQYGNAEMNCNLDATKATASVPVVAGSSIDLQWTPWPDTHHGPVIDYLAPCNGDCTSFSGLKWHKIAQTGLIRNTPVPGYWADDQLIANNNTWTLKIPSNLAAGNYVLRHEIIALHSAGTEGGAQNYPWCVTLKVTGGGSNKLSSGGTAATSLYKSTDNGIIFNIYTQQSSYPIPGPALETV